MKYFYFHKDYRFGFNGQHKENEVAGIGNHNSALFWEYDTRLGRRWNIDPVDQIRISNYATFGNNPITNTDKLGDVVKGVKEKDATRTKQTLDNTFTGNDKKEFRDLLKIGKDKKTFEKIPLNKFMSATKGFSDDELALATGYMDKINSDETNYVEAVFSTEDVSEKGQAALLDKDISTGLKLDREAGGGANSRLDANSTITVFVMDSKSESKSDKDFIYTKTKQYTNMISSGGQILAHELIGHGGGGRYTALQSIQAENLYLRVIGSSIQRTGLGHANYPDGGWRPEQTQGTPIGLQYTRTIRGASITK